MQEPTYQRTIHVIPYTCINLYTVHIKMTQFPEHVIILSEWSIWYTRNIRVYWTEVRCLSG